MFSAQWRGRFRDHSYALCANMQSLPQLSTILIRMVEVLQLINIHWHIIMTQSSQLTWGLALGAAFQYLLIFSFLEQSTPMVIPDLVTIHFDFSIWELSLQLSHSECNPHSLSPIPAASLLQHHRHFPAFGFSIFHCFSKYPETFVDHLFLELSIFPYLHHSAFRSSRFFSTCSLLASLLRAAGGNATTSCSC